MELQVNQEFTTSWSKSILCSSPCVVLVADAVDPALTAALIGLAELRLENALLSGTNGGVQGSARTCQIAWFSHREFPAVRAAVDILASIVGKQSHYAERLQVIRYSATGEYKPHFDSYDMATERGRRCTVSRGQRIHTALLYLNDHFSGGSTVFPRLGIEIHPREGAVLSFENCVSGTTVRHEKSLHAGSPVLEGEKWVATLWFRER